nr:protein transport protein SEC16B homolog [Ipomoea batatas]
MSCCTDYSKLKPQTEGKDSVKEVGWSAFNAVPGSNGDSGFGSYSDFFTVLGEGSGRFQEWLQLMPPFLLQRHQAEDVNADEEAAAADRIILPELQNAPAHATADEIVLADD